jgi:hypothetical protein
MPDKIQPNDSNPPNIPWFLYEKLVPLAQAARLFPPLRNRKGNAVHPSTLYRWGKKGRRSRNGKLVRLDICLAGGTNCTSKEAIERFFRSLNDEDDEHDKDNEDDGTAIGIRPGNPPNSPGFRAKENVALRDQSQEAMQILAQRGYGD